jgi:Tfp pilus assembly protein PilF
MTAFFWAVFEGVVVFLAARVETTWLRYAAAISGGAFVGMMYGAFPPGFVRNRDAWMLAFVLSPVSAIVATYVLRHAGKSGSLGAAAGAGALAGLLFIGPMSALLVRLWDEANGLAELGELYLHNETFAPKAVAYLDRAIALGPATARYYDLRAIGLARMNETERAAADWDHASRLAPDDPEPHVHRGVDGLRRGALQDAVRSLESALAKNREHGRAHAYLGAAWERQGELTRAFELYDRAVALAGDDARVYCERSNAYVRHGDYESALRDAERAVRLEERLGIAYAARAHALAMLRREEEAEESLREAIECGLEPAVHQDVLRGLESLHGGAADEGHG